MCSHTHSAWPVYVSIGNHTAAARDSPSGKNLIAFINIPKKRKEDTLPGYTYCFRYLYQAVWASIFHVANQWAGGFWLVLPGDTTPTLVVPRLGVPIADIMELRNLAATTSTCAIRCDWVFRGGVGGTGAEGTAVLDHWHDGDLDDFMAIFLDDAVAAPGAVPVDTGAGATEDDGGDDADAAEDEDDHPCNPEDFADLFDPPQVLFTEY